MLLANIGKSRKPRKDALYSLEEIKVISKHKQEYREQTTQPLQAEIFTSKILVDLFNYWLRVGKAPREWHGCHTPMGLSAGVVTGTGVGGSIITRDKPVTRLVGDGSGTPTLASVSLSPT